MNKFKKGDAVIHRSDNKSRKMVVVDQCFKKLPPETIHQEFVNVGRILEGSYYCTWISGSKKGDGYFAEIELDFQ